MRKRLMRYVFAACCLLAGAAQCHAGTVTFGSGANQFNMEFVTIGNPGNASDTTGTPNPAGAVGYTYGIGKFEVSEDMIDKYNANFGTANGLEITKDTRTPNKPATSVSWNEAARFVNWLNTSQGYHQAYKFVTADVNDNIELWTSSDPGYNSLNKYRNNLARYALPDYNEWYKAAYYDPANSVYYNYPTGSDSRPTAVTSGREQGTAVYSHEGEASPNIYADVNEAGGLSSYGVMGLGGNAREWDERSIYFGFLGSFPRGVRGGYIGDFYNFLSSSVYEDMDPSRGDGTIGFRIVDLSPSSPPSAVPEPSMMVIGTLFGLGGLVAKRRMKR